MYPAMLPKALSQLMHAFNSFCGLSRRCLLRRHQQMADQCKHHNTHAFKLWSADQEGVCEGAGSERSFLKY